MKRIAYPIIFFLILLIIAFVADGYLGKKYSSNPAINANWVWQMQGQNLDYAVMGSSRVKSGFDVACIDSLTHKNGLNIGDHGIGIAEQYLLVNKFLRANKTKYLLLQVDYAAQNSEDYSYPFHDYNYFAYLGDTAVSRVMADKTGNIKYLFWKYIPGYKYAEFNSEYTRELFVEKAKMARDAKGFVAIKKDPAKNNLNSFDANKGKKNAAMAKQQFGNFGYNKADSVYLHKLLSYAAANGVKVILFTSPENVDGNPEYVQKMVPDMVKYYQAIAAKYKVPYFHFFGSAFSNNRQNISGDGLHLTYESITPFSHMMADSMGVYMK
jgi:hypothetical protein